MEERQNMAPRLKEKYWSEVVPALREQLQYENVNEIPRLQKIVINMGVGAAVQDIKQLDAAIEDNSCAQVDRELQDS
jgi:large subunit ribosomal protein L5